MGDTLQGFFASDFGKVNNPPLTFQFGERNLNSATTRVIQAFSMPSNRSSVEVWKSYVADQNGSAVSGLSLVVRDDVNSSVIHSETSAQLQEGVDSPLSSGGSAATRVILEAKNEAGTNLTAPNGMVALRLV